MSIRIYHVPGTRSVRVIWLCDELGIPCEVVPIDFSPDYRNSLEWRALSPTGKVPAMADGEMTMFESGAMVLYILEKYGEGRLQPPSGSTESAKFHQWCWFAEATLARPLGDIAQHTRIRAEADRIPGVAEDGAARARSFLGAVEDAVKDQEYLLEEFSAADIMMGYSLMLAERMDVLDQEHPNVQRYFERLKARPGFQKAVA